MKFGTLPFNYCVIDNFLQEDLADKLADEFPGYENNLWFDYDNPLENKRTCNHWEKFPPATYSFFSEMLGREPANVLGRLVDADDLIGDIGLHGGGWHIHKRGGKLNIHQDYSIHPKLGLERKVNLILYLSRDWNSQWGGGLELWSHDHENNKPKQCEQLIACKFNRAVIFRTDQFSWHGLPQPISCPEGVFRKSLALYYLSIPSSGANPRKRALFAPTLEQEGDPSIESFIQVRQSF
jgi:Rps23 Pro-64 3,4-dihydroxylase Tpa1-like proline 4-hydroxylase